jgi:hypothetical protein
MENNFTRFVRNIRKFSGKMSDKKLNEDRDKKKVQ